MTPPSIPAEQLPDTLQVLSSVSCFAGLDQEVLGDLAGITHLHHFDKGETVFLQGDPCQGLYIVQSGWLKSLLISPSGREQIVRLVGPGESFNEHGVFLREGCNLVTVEAVEETDVWLIDRTALLKIMDRYPILCRTITQNLAARVVHLMKLVEDLSLHTVESRLARLILERSALALEKQRWATQAEMAATLGTVVDVVNRALHKLEGEGLVRINRHRIEIVNRAELEKKADQCD